MAPKRDCSSWGLRAALGLSVLGCIDSDSPARSPAAQNIAEIKLVGNLNIGPTPVTRIGGSNESRGHTLHLVQGAVLLANGSVAVANEGSQSVLYYDSIGTFVREAGGAGGGPGEFLRIRSVYRLPADTVLAWDAAAGRITIFDSESAAVQTVLLRKSGRLPVLTRRPRPRDLLMVNDTTFVAISTFGVPRVVPSGFFHDSSVISVVNRAGDDLAMIGTLARNLYFERSLAPLNYRFFAAATRTGFYIGNGRDAELTEFRSNWRERRTLLLPIERKPITRADRDRLIDSYLRGVDEENRPAVARRVQQGLVVDTFPAFTAIASSRAFIWLRMYAHADQGNDWLAIDPVALTAKRVTLPHRSIVLDATEDRVLVLMRDEMDRQELGVYKTRPPNREVHKP